jgi:thiosulfate/3-mercaptopyruvate sulfurtransferase
MEPSVDPAWLRDHLDDTRVRIVDCRFALGQPGAGHERYLAGHIPGAAFLDLDTDLSGPVGDGRDGRHPLPAPEEFTGAVRRAGIGNDTTVVAYDDRSGGAARLWWLLRHFGHDQVAVLDGGLAAWAGPLRAGAEDIAAGDWTPGVVRDDDTVDVRDVAARLRMPGHVLVDARAPERYRGDVEPIDPVPGHIPGAVNVPFTRALPDELVTTSDEIVVYCGSGVTACMVLLDLAARGRSDAKLYPGSYSEWSTRHLPVERE